VLYRDWPQFANTRAPWPRARVEPPWPADPLVTVLSPWFRPRGRVRVLDKPDCATLAAVRPEALAGPVTLLRQALNAAESGLLQLDLAYGVLAFIGLGRPLIEPEDRDRLWRWFRVPVFVQFRGFGGELLAAECDCHDGLHFDPRTAVWEHRGPTGELLVTSLVNHRYPALRLATRLRAEIDTAPCPCGMETPRLRSLAAA